MGLILRKDQLSRYQEIGRFLVKYGRSDLVRELDIGNNFGGEPASPKASEEMEELASDLEALGPTFVKLGQILSSRTDLLPPPVITALSRLQDDVKPVPLEDIERTIFLELGVRISKAFSEFHEEPEAAASLGQVHRAKLRDGRDVAVKVQRPEIRQQIMTDLEILHDIASFFARHTEIGARHAPTKFVEEVRQSLCRELDYRKEAENLERVRRNLEEFENILVVRPIHDYSTSRVLTMEFISGTKISQISPLVRTELDTGALAEELFRAYLKQILVDGLVHADPHPGNVFLTHDGKVALLDLGMVAHIPPLMQGHLVKLLLAISEGHGEEAANLAAKICEKTDDFEPVPLRTKITQTVVENQDATLAQLAVGQLVLRIAQIAGESGLLVPAQLTMLGKALMSLDEAARCLDEGFNPSASIRRNASRLLQERMKRSFSLGSVYNTMLETNEFLTRLPNRLNEILEMVTHNEIRFTVDALDEQELLHGLQKVANRITMGLVLAALIVGAAMLMDVDTDFTLLGYPGIAMISFLIAFSLGVAMVISIWWSDRKNKKLRRRKRMKNR